MQVIGAAQKAILDEEQRAKLAFLLDHAKGGWVAWRHNAGCLLACICLHRHVQPLPCCLHSAAIKGSWFLRLAWVCALCCGLHC